MTLEQSDRMMLGWSREQLANASGVGVAAVYLLERMGTAGVEDDARIRSALALGKKKHVRHKTFLDENIQSGSRLGGQAANTNLERAGAKELCVLYIVSSLMEADVLRSVFQAISV